MVYAPKDRKVKAAIIGALDNCTSSQTGIGYNVLFERVKKTAGSRRTFHKYLRELRAQKLVSIERDPRHRRGILIYRSEDAKFHSMLLRSQGEVDRILSKGAIDEAILEFHRPPNHKTAKQYRTLLYDLIELWHGVVLAAQWPEMMQGALTGPWFRVGVFRTEKAGPVITIKGLDSGERERLEREYGKLLPPKWLEKFKKPDDHV